LAWVLGCGRGWIGILQFFGTCGKLALYFVDADCHSQGWGRILRIWMDFCGLWFVVEGREGRVHTYSAVYNAVDGDNRRRRQGTRTLRAAQRGERERREVLEVFVCLYVCCMWFMRVCEYGLYACMRGIWRCRVHEPI
jgi:hypothetical protein